MVAIELFFKLLIGHAFADFIFQSRDMAYFKSPAHRCQFEDESNRGKKLVLIWPYVLWAHSVSHGAFVYLFTGSFTLAIVETCSHFLIDIAKCLGKINVHVDQLLHIICKGIYVCVLSY